VCAWITSRFVFSPAKTSPNLHNAAQSGFHAGGRAPSPARSPLPPLPAAGGGVPSGPDTPSRAFAAQMFFLLVEKGTMRSETQSRFVFSVAKTSPNLHNAAQSAFLFTAFLIRVYSRAFVAQMFFFTQICTTPHKLASCFTLFRFACIRVHSRPKCFSGTANQPERNIVVEVIQCERS